MASIRREILIEARPEVVWDAVRDVGAVHERLAPGFVVDTRLEDGARVVTFASGLVAREVIVDVDDGARRLVWAVVGSPRRITTPRCRSSPTATVAVASSGSPTCCRTRSRAPSRGSSNRGSGR